MNTKIIITSLFLTLFVAVSPKPVEETTKLVHILFRHGDRNPTASYPNDPYKDYPWQDGYAALTPKGKEQLYNLGKTLHGRYEFFFKQENVSTNIIYARSSDADRCLMSGGAFLAGFYPPEKHQVWNPDLNWQPIPLHSLPSKLDNFITVTKPCPKYSKALEDALNSPEMQKFNEEHKELYQYLEEKTGKPVKDINDVEGLYYTLEIEEDRGLELPEWTKKYYPQPMKEIAIKNLEIFTATDYMKKIKGGPFLTDMIHNMQWKLNKTLTPDRSIFVYSAHDITLMNVLRTIGLPFHLKPDYAAAFVLEAHSTSKNDDFLLKMLYYNSSSSVEPIELKLEGCGDPCLLEQFVEVVKDVLVDDWEEECKV